VGLLFANRSVYRRGRGVVEFFPVWQIHTCWVFPIPRLLDCAATIAPSYYLSYCSVHYKIAAVIVTFRRK
jgi:hypothetical protein